MDAPLIRKALARRFQAGGEWAKAVHHLEAARELAPGDGAIHRALVAAFDAWQKPEQAIAALYGSIRLAPYALDAYTDLARRYRKAGDEAQAERALTNLVEPAPNQADGHRRLATVRQEQKRWPDAVVQWRQVVRTEPKDPMGALSLARALIQTGETAEARRVLEQVLRTEWAKRHGDPKATATEILKSISG